MNEIVSKGHDVQTVQGGKWVTIATFASYSEAESYKKMMRNAFRSLRIV